MYVHDCRTSGHFCSSKTLSHLKQGVHHSGTMWGRLVCSTGIPRVVTIVVRTRKPLCFIASPWGLIMQEKVHVNILVPFSPPSTTWNQYLQMIVDQFPKWVQCFPIANKVRDSLIGLRGRVSLYNGESIAGWHWTGWAIRSCLWSVRHSKYLYYSVSPLLQWPSGEIQSDPAPTHLLPPLW